MKSILQERAHPERKAIGEEDDGDARNENIIMAFYDVGHDDADDEPDFEEDDERKNESGEEEVLEAF